MNLVWVLIIWFAGSSRIEMLHFGDFPDRAACDDAGLAWVTAVDQWSPNLRSGYGCLPREVR